ncbi:MAG: hypothetical protein KJZ93_13705 [Caldilineaceae bacterium]|nr:hypothetical protein [Caldilineaceae bacterium]
MMIAPKTARPQRRAIWLGILLSAALTLTACGGMGPAAAPPTPTNTPTPIPTPTPPPTPTPAPEVSAAAAQPAVTPQVVIPQGFTTVTDERLGYSFATPRGWTELDLRGSQFQTLAGMFGMADQMGPLNEFLNSPEGQMLGKIYITDLTAAMFGGLPTLLAVTVADAPGYTAEAAKQLVEDLLRSNAGLLGEVQIDQVEATVVNNLPAVRGSATANLAAVGMNAGAFAKVVGLLANDKIYVMVLLAQDTQRAAKEPILDQIIGTFRPE